MDNVQSKKPSYLRGTTSERARDRFYALALRSIVPRQAMFPSYAPLGSHSLELAQGSIRTHGTDAGNGDLGVALTRFVTHVHVPDSRTVRVTIQSSIAVMKAAYHRPSVDLGLLLLLGYMQHWFR
jgi:hypothetical protein